MSMYTKTVLSYKIIRATSSKIRRHVCVWNANVVKSFFFLLFGVATCLLMACQLNHDVVADKVTSQPDLPIKGVSLTKDGYLFVLDKNGILQRLTDSDSPSEIAIPDRDVIAISFISKDVGWILARSGKLFSTYNSGLNWNLLAQLNDQFSSSVTGQLEFVDINNGWLIQRFGVLKSTDGGRSWQEITSSSDYVTKTVVQPTFIFPVDDSMAWVGLTGGGVLKVNNQGAIFSDLELKNDDTSVVFALNKSSCWAGTGNANGLFVTENGGGSWNQVFGKNTSERFGISSVYFKDTHHGWVAGTKLTTNTSDITTQPVLLKTQDGGKNWQHVYVIWGINESPILIRFYDNEKGWLVTDRSIFQSNDGGISWARIFERN